MQFCPHKNIYIEKSFGYNNMDANGDGGTAIASLINLLITYCADCGETIKEVEIKEKK